MSLIFRCDRCSFDYSDTTSRYTVATTTIGRTTGVLSDVCPKCWTNLEERVNFLKKLWIKEGATWPPQV